MKYTMNLLLCAALIFTLGCSKDGTDGLPGPQGPQGTQGPQGQTGQQGEPGPSANVYEFTLTFGTSTTVQTHQMPSGSMYGKVTFVYLDTGFMDWALLPYYQNNPGFIPVNYVAICDELMERIQIRTDRGDNQEGSPWAVNNVQRSFKAVVLETSGMDEYDGVDFENYAEVRETFNLE